MRSLGCKLLFGAAGFMALGCAIHILVDYHTYRASYGSAPFWIWAVTDCILWLIPGALALAAGLVVRKKMKNKENDHGTGK